MEIIVSFLSQIFEGFSLLFENLSLSADSWSMSWWMMSISLAVLCVSVFIYLFIEMPIATLWSYVMIGKW